MTEVEVTSAVTYQRPALLEQFSYQLTIYPQWANQAGASAAVMLSMASVIASSSAFRPLLDPT
jgi:hypothetical protein